MNNSSAYPLFISSVVKTATNFHNNLTDSNVRLNETKQALDSIIQKGYFKEIVIVDGSDHDILTVQEIQNYKQQGVIIEQLRFQQDSNLVDQFGKGNGEMQITNYMVDNSQLVNKANGFHKLTARYFFDNFDEVIAAIDGYDNVFYFYHPPFVRKYKSFIATIFYKTSLDFYKSHIYNSMHLHSKTTAGLLESIFFKKLINLPKTAIRSVYPKYSGTSGTTGKQMINRLYNFRNLCSKMKLMAYNFK